MSKPLRLLLSGFLVVMVFPLDAQDLERDITYGIVDGVELQLDLARPPRITGTAPAVVFIHGGGFVEGSRRHFHGFVRRFAQAGFVAASISYRLAPAHPLPASIQDAKCAIRFLRAHAAEYGIDPDRIAVVGESAGGLLALMTGLSSTDLELEGDGGHDGISSAVQAVVSICGIAALTREYWTEVPSRSGAGAAAMGIILFGIANPDASPLPLRCSPLTHVDASDPPVLLLHGEQDRVVPFRQARILEAALTAVAVPVQLRLLDYPGHGMSREVRPRIESDTLVFVQQCLRHPATIP